MKTDASLPLQSPRIVVIVARDRPELYEYLARGFTGFDDVQIIVDRRLPEPPGELPRAPGGLGGQWTPDVYDELMLRGFVIRRLVDAGGDADDREILAVQRRISEYAYRAEPGELERDASNDPDGVKW